VLRHDGQRMRVVARFICNACAAQQALDRVHSTGLPRAERMQRAWQLQTRCFEQALLLELVSCCLFGAERDEGPEVDGTAPARVRLVPLTGMRERRVNNPLCQGVGGLRVSCKSM
jgi:hypothetical protein